METAFAATVYTTQTYQPDRNVEPTQNLSPVSRPFCGGVFECTTGQLLSLFVVLLIVAFYLTFLILWLVNL